MGALLGRRPADAAGDGFPARPVRGHYDRGGCVRVAWDDEPLGHDRSRNRRRHAGQLAVVLVGHQVWRSADACVYRPL